MEQYTSKAAVVAEIERLKKEDGNPYFPSETADQYYARGVHFTCDRLVNFLDALEVKEVDLEKEVEDWVKTGPHTSYPWCTIPDAIRITAEHFYELGLKKGYAN